MTHAIVLQSICFFLQHARVHLVQGKEKMAKKIICVRLWVFTVFFSTSRLYKVFPISLSSFSNLSQSIQKIQSISWQICMESLLQTHHNQFTHLYTVYFFLSRLQKSQMFHTRIILTQHCCWHDLQAPSHLVAI